MKKRFAFLSSYNYTAEAEIFKGLLESQGVEVFMRDNFTIEADPLVSNAIGGVKLFVFENDLKRATEILSAVKQYSVDDNGEPVECPNCHAHECEMVTSASEKKTLLGIVGAFLFTGLPLYAKFHYKCAACGFEFPVQK